MLVRWYVAYPMSYRDIEELAAERNLKVDHSTINRWVIHYAPQLEASFRKRCKRPVGTSWRMDETYIKVKGNWVYLSLTKKARRLISCYQKSVTNWLRVPFSTKQSIRMACLKRSRWIKVVLIKLASTQSI